MTHTFRNPPAPPFYAVIFVAELTDTDRDNYKQTGDRMLALAQQQPGYLGYVDMCAGGDNSFNVSYWKDLESIRKWREHCDHKAAQKLGRDRWYKRFEINIARVERSYTFTSE
jgi:heme-degrading monooxygenase HmoA